MWFAYQVVWPQGFSGTFEWPSALIGIVAALALFHYQVEIIPVIGACGGLGLMYSLSKPLLGEKRRVLPRSGEFYSALCSAPIPGNEFVLTSRHQIAHALMHENDIDIG